MLISTFMGYLRLCIIVLPNYYTRLTDCLALYLLDFSVYQSSSSDWHWKIFFFPSLKSKFILSVRKGLAVLTITLYRYEKFVFLFGQFGVTILCVNQLTFKLSQLYETIICYWFLYLSFNYLDFTTRKVVRFVSAFIDIIF